MPKATIWIREEDFDAWEKIGDRPQFISDAINGRKYDEVQLAEGYPKTDKTPPPVLDDPNIDIAANLFAGKCKNGHPSADGKHCLNVGCVYS